MNKNTYFVIEEKHKSGKVFSHAEKIANAYNLIFAIKPMKDCELISVNACDTWKEAQEVAAFWNEGARNRGQYLFA